MAVAPPIKVELRARIQKFVKQMKRAQVSIKETTSAFAGISVKAGAAATALAGIGIAVTSVAAKFEKTMTNVAAIAAGGEKGFTQAFSKMSAKALEMAGKTQFTANQVGSAMKFMAMAGLGVEKTMAALPSVLQLASAAEVELGEAADVVTNIMTAMGKKAEELGDVNNILVGVFTHANVSLTELAESFKYAGAIAKTVGVSTEELAASIGVLGNAGIKGSMAGTGLRKMMIAMHTATGRSADSMELLGVTVEDISGTGGGIATLVRKLEVAKEALGADAFTGHAMQLFGLRAGPQLAALVEQGSESIIKLTQVAEDAKKTKLAEFLAKQKMSTMIGQWDLLKSAIEKVSIQFGEALAPSMSRIIKLLQKVFARIAAMTPGLKDLIVTIGKWAFGITSVVAILAGLVTGIGLAVIAVYGFVTAWMSLGALMATTGAAAAAVTSPIWLIVAAVAATVLVLTQWIAGLFGTNSALTKNISYLDVMKDAITEATSSATGFKSTMLNAVKALIAPIARLLFLWDELADSVEDSTDKMHRQEFLDPLTNQAIDLDNEMKKTLKTLEKFKKKYGRYLGATGALEWYGPDATKRHEGEEEQLIYGKFQSEVALNDYMPLAVNDAEIKLAEIMYKLVSIDRKRVEVQEKLNAAKEKGNEEAKKEGETEEDTAAKRTKALKEYLENMTRVTRAAEKLRKQEAAITAAIKERARLKAAAEKAIPKKQEELQRAVDVIDVGKDLGPVMEKLFTFGDEVDKLSKHFRDAGMNTQRDLINQENLRGQQDKIFLDSLRSWIGKNVKEKELVNRLGDINELLGAWNIDEILPGEIDFSAVKKVNIKTDKTDYIDDLDITVDDAFIKADKVESTYQGVRGRQGNLESNLGQEFFTFAQRWSEEAATKGDSAQAIAAAGTSGKAAEAITSMAGGGGGFGSMLGSTIGAAIGSIWGPAGTKIGTIAGQIIGGIVEKVILMIPKMIMGLIKTIASVMKAVPKFLAGLIPDFVDSRLKSSMSNSKMALATLPLLLSAIVSLWMMSTMAVVGTIGATLAALTMIFPPLSFAIIGVTGALLAMYAATMVITGVAAAALSSVAGILGTMFGIATQGFKNEIVLDENNQQIKAPERDAWTRFTDAFGVSLDRIVLAMQPVIEALFPLAVLFDFVVQLFLPFANGLASGTSGARALFDMFKLLAMVLGNFAIFVAVTWNAVMGMLQRTIVNLATNMDTNMAFVFQKMFDMTYSLATSFAGLIFAMGHLVRWMGIFSADAGLISIGDSMITFATDITGAGPLVQQMIQDGFMAVTSMEFDEDAIREKMAAIVALTYDSAMDLFPTLDDVNGGLEGLSESLTNVPAGFKVNLERWRAATGDAGPGPGMGGGGGGGIVGGVGGGGGGGGVGGGVGGGGGVADNILGVTVGEFFARMANAIAEGVCLAVASGCCCGPQTAIPATASTSGETYYDYSIRDIIINANTTDADGIANEVVSAIERRNYFASGNQFSNFTNGGSWRS